MAKSNKKVNRLIAATIEFLGGKW